VPGVGVDPAHGGQFTSAPPLVTVWPGPSITCAQMKSIANTLLSASVSVALT
jgi:hypothetical protein